MTGIQSLMNLCPTGSTARVTVSTEYPTASMSINIAGSGVTLSVPVQRIKVSVECTQLPPPPPPPPPPSPPKLEIWDPFDYNLSVLMPDQLSSYQAGLFYVGVSLPGFVALTDAQPQLSTWAIQANGSQQTANFGMYRDGNGFRLSNPGAVDYWSATAAGGARYGGWQVTGVVARSIATGYGRFGVAQSMGALVVSSFADTITVSSPTTRGTNVNKS